MSEARALCSEASPLAWGRVDARCEMKKKDALCPVRGGGWTQSEEMEDERKRRRSRGGEAACRVSKVGVYEELDIRVPRHSLARVDTRTQTLALRARAASFAGILGGL